MRIAVRKDSVPGDLSTLIYVKPQGQLQTGARSDQGVQIDRGLSGLPKQRV